MINCSRCHLKDFIDERVLTAHLVNDHLQNATQAASEARAAVAIAGLPNGTVHKTPPLPTTAPKETPMADLSKPITCAGCKKPFTRTHHLQKTCEACRGGACTDCHSKGGHHTPSCSRGKKKAAGQGARRPKKSTPAKSGTLRLDADLESKLTAAKSRVTQLRADLALEEMRVQIISDLVGA